MNLPAGPSNEPEATAVRVRQKEMDGSIVALLKMVAVTIVATIAVALLLKLAGITGPFRSMNTAIALALGIFAGDWYAYGKTATPARIMLGLFVGLAISLAGFYTMDVLILPDASR